LKYRFVGGEALASWISRVSQERELKIVGAPLRLAVAYVHRRTQPAWRSFCNLSCTLRVLLKGVPETSG